MRYACLLYGSDEEWEALPADEQARVHAAYAAFAEQAAEAGALVDGFELRPAATATTVRVRDGETLVSDGPFAETREQLGGFFVLECPSMEDAVALARRLPAAEHGAVEVRAQYAEREEAA